MNYWALYDSHKRVTFSFVEIFLERLSCEFSNYTYGCEVIFVLAKPKVEKFSFDPLIRKAFSKSI